MKKDLNITGAVATMHKEGLKAVLINKIIRYFHTSYRYFHHHISIQQSSVLLINNINTIFLLVVLIMIANSFEPINLSYTIIFS